MASIEFLCRAAHANDATHSGPTITLNEGLWSYCERGAWEHHTWDRVPAATVAEIQLASHHRIIVARREVESSIP